MILLTFLDRQNEIALKPGGVIQLSGFIKNMCCEDERKSYGEILTEF